MILINGILKSFEILKRTNTNSICQITIGSHTRTLQLTNNQLNLIIKSIGIECSIYYTMDNGKLALIKANENYSTIFETTKNKPNCIKITIDNLIKYSLDDFEIQHQYGMAILSIFYAILPIYMIGMAIFFRNLNHLYKNATTIGNKTYF